MRMRENNLSKARLWFLIYVNARVEMCGENMYIQLCGFNENTTSLQRKMPSQKKKIHEEKYCREKPRTASTK